MWDGRPSPAELGNGTAARIRPDSEMNQLYKKQNKQHHKKSKHTHTQAHTLKTLQINQKYKDNN